MGYVLIKTALEVPSLLQNHHTFWGGIGMKILSGIPVLALLMVGAVTPSFATSLPVNGTVVPNTVATFFGFNTLGVIASESYSATPASGPPDTGTIETAVGTWSGNPFGPNDLTFVYIVLASSGDVTRVTGSDFAGFNIDVEQLAEGSNSNPAISADLNSLGVVGFNFTPPVSNELGPGKETYLLIVNTNATIFTAGTVSVIDAATATDPAFEPTVAPEPSTLSLLGTGLLAVGAGLRRRMRRAV